MDGKTKKILNYLKKNEGDWEALDISFGLNMDEDFVQNALDSLVQENLAASKRNEQGKVLYTLASGESAAEKAAPAPEKAPKKTKGKAAAGPEDHFDEFVLENEAVNIVTDTIATHIDDISAAPAPSTAVFEAVQPPPTPSSTAVFEAVQPPPAPLPSSTEIDDDFAPKPKRGWKKPAPPTEDISINDDFAPKPKKGKAAAPSPEDTGIDDDDFSPKPKKNRKKAAGFDGDTPQHDDDAGPKTKPSTNLIAAAAAAIVIIIASVALSAAISGSKIKSAIANMERDVVKTLDFETYKTETDKTIKSLTAKNKALETKVKNLEDRAKKQDKPAAATAAAAKKKKR